MSQTVDIEDFTKAIKTAYCIDLNTRDRQVVEGCKRVTGRLEAVPDHDGHIAVVCYGPSLEESWPQLKSFKHIITCSGAHKFLIDHGVIPTWHCEVDPRPHKADLIGKPHKDVTYLVASVCHQKVYDLLEGYNVKLWHVFGHEAARDGVPVAYPHGEWAITGGSNIGLRSMVLARFLGFKKMTIFGMDYSFKNDGTQHAGWHPNETSRFHAVEADGNTYYTSGPMHHYCQEFFREITKIGDVTIDVAGDGLLQAQYRETLRKGPLKREKKSMIAATLPKVISAEYKQLNQQLHEQNPDYGTSGSKRVPIVLAMIEKVKPSTVLDYGCGKGLLGQGLPIPIWEYDPCIAGKDRPPRPADMVVCTDVLEHIEPDYLDSVLLDIARCTLKVCYCVINTGPAIKTLPDGRNTHLIQKDEKWWQKRLSAHFEVAKIETKDTEITVILGPKKKPKQAPPMDFSNRITPCRQSYGRDDYTEVKFHTPDDTTFWRAKTLFTKEPCTIEWINGMKAGEVLYDVGANVGSYTIWAGAKGLKVEAFEPNPDFCTILSKNIDTNNHYSSYVHTTALGDGDNGLDKFGLRKPDYIKIDVDGDEPAIVRGAKHTVLGCKSILVEVNPNSQPHLDMVKELESWGFTYSEKQVSESRRKEGRFKGYAEYIFTRQSHTEKAIAAAELMTYPSPHIYIENALPEAEFQKLLSYKVKYKPISQVRPVKGYKKRYVADSPIQLDLRKSLCAKFGISPDNLTDETLLIRDKAGYSIGPHTDSPQKVISALFYLEGEGTSLYIPLDKGRTCPGGPHHNFKDFERIATMPAKPNSLFAFLKTNNSFHGVEPTTKQRTVLLYDIRKCQS